MKDFSVLAATAIHRYLVAILVLFSCVSLSAQTVRITGQDTLIFVGQKWKGFLEIEQPQLARSIVVEGGNPGLSAITSRSADILQTRQLLNTPLAIRIPVAIEAIVVYVNDANPIRELSLAELKAIYTGSITNWKQLGGPNQRIELYAGESTTGIEDYFQQAVLKGQESFFEGKPSTRALLETIAARPNAIGYASLRSMPGVHAISIRKSEGGLAVKPSIENIRRMQYPISRYIYWYILRAAKRPALELSKWIVSSHGQLVADSVGFFPLMPDDRNLSLAKLNPQQ